MPLSNLLKSAAGTCHFCKQKAGIISREHPECRRTFQSGRNETVRPGADGAKFQQSETPDREELPPPPPGTTPLPSPGQGSPPRNGATPGP